MIITLHRTHTYTWCSIALAGTLLSGCATSYSREDIGTALGAIIGGSVGSLIGKGSGRTAAIIGGTVLGGIAGRAIGGYMDDRDREMAKVALDTTPTGGTKAWHNDNTGNDFSLTPVRNYYSDEGHPCREFIQEAVVDGQRQSVRGAACKEPDQNAWVIN